MKKTIKTLLIDNGDKIIVHFHGFTSCKEENKVLIDWCNKNNISYAGIDFPGQGETKIDEKDKSTIDYLTTIGVGFVRSLNKKNIIISGHSMGGLIACLVANSLGDEIVNKLVLEDPVNPCFLEDETIRLKLLNLLKEKETFLVNENDSIVDVEMDQARSKWYKEIANDLLSEKTLSKFKAFIETTKIKTYILFGKDDLVVPFTESFKYFKSLRNNNINFIEIPDAKHVVHNDNQDEYIKIFDKYIKE